MNKRGGITAIQMQLGQRTIAYSAGYRQRTYDELANHLERKGRSATWTRKITSSCPAQNWRMALFMHPVVYFGEL
jgi:hypothetical protein